MIPRLTAALDFHAQALTLRAERQRVIAGNIANAETPGYQARDFDFASALRAASGEPGRAGEGIAQGVMRQSTGAPGSVQPTLRYAVPSQTNLDANTVDMDRERAAFADNSVKYEATLRFINGNVRTMLDAMKHHNQG
ncbi:MAG TPA: flagellar basal body rod protein FlgB [Rubrivivax sp.]|jgi:flagellar basal-body rod protein FlgB|nr:flagellar basal body rod protein FlgB [Rubrivivax sp.]